MGGWCASGFGPRVVVLEPSPSKQLLTLKRRHQLRINPRGFGGDGDAAEAVVMAVKPQMFADVARECANLVARDTVVISIAAGVSIATTAGAFGKDTAIVRAMPNLPALVGKGITVAVANSNVTAKQKRMAGSLLAAAGEVVWVDKESYLDPVTAVSGSGPAYVFLLIECLTRAARDVGLPQALAERLARATIVGAGALIDATGEAAGALREGVTSPGGTTAAALAVLMKDPGMDSLVRQAVAAATARSKELGR